MEKHEILTQFIPLLQEVDEIGGWGKSKDDRVIHGKPVQSLAFQYNETVDRFIRTVLEETPEEEYFSYNKTLEENGLSYKQPVLAAADVSNLDSKAIIAMLNAIIAGERFSPGAVGHFIKNGCIIRWLERLKDIDRAENASSPQKAVSFSQVVELFDSNAIWNNSNELFMYEWLWELLDEQGFTTYTDDRDYYRVIIYAVVLIYTYDQFCSLALDYGGYEDFYYKCTDVLDGEISEVMIGQLLCQLDDYEPIEDLEDAIMALLNGYQYRLIHSLFKKMLKTDPFAIMYFANQQFIEIAESDGDYEEYEADINSLEEYKAKVEENWQQAYEDFAIIEGYSWLKDFA